MVLRDQSPRSDHSGELPRPGEILANTYQISDMLGEGGMGVVLRARDLPLARDVAIKFVRPEYATNDLVREQFVHEARAMASVRDTNVVGIHSFGEFHGMPYFVMEFVEGTTLRGWLEDRGHAALAVDEALGFLKQICRGVQAIHETGIVHRDLKPSNILIDRKFRVAVADLGLVQVMNANTSGASGSLAGTLSYLAPEVALGEEVAPDLANRSDIYSLGVLAFELLTGHLPFEADSAAEMLRRHLESEPAAASDVRGDLPAAFDPVLRRAMAKDPARRMASARVFHDALAQSRPTYL